MKINTEIEMPSPDNYRKAAKRWYISDNLESIRVSFIYSFVLDDADGDNHGKLSGTVERFCGREKTKVEENANSALRLLAETFECKYGKPSSGFDNDETTEMGREGFDPILNSGIDSTSEFWFSAALQDSAKPTLIFSGTSKLTPERTTVLGRVNDIGAGTLTITMTFGALNDEKIFPVLDLVRKHDEQKDGENISGLPQMSYYTKSDGEKHGQSLFDFFRDIFHASVVPAFSLPESYSLGCYQCPYVVTHMQFDKIEAENIEKVDQLPWETQDMDWKDLDLKKRIQVEQLVSLLLRPQIWDEYYRGEDKNKGTKTAGLYSFRVPDDLLERHWPTGHDFFWDRRALILFHPRSTLYLSALPWNEPRKNLSKRTWCSLVDIIETIRSRWHFFLSLNTQLDHLRSVAEKPDQMIPRLFDLRSRLVRALTYTLPYGYTSSHLVELAQKAEKELLVNDLYELVMRKFETVTSLYSDHVERERRTWMEDLVREREVVKRSAEVEQLTKQAEQLTKQAEQLAKEIKQATMSQNETEKGDGV